MPTLKEPATRPGVSSTLFITVCLTLAALLILLHQYPRPLAPTPTRLRPCSRIVLVSAARHGSTWFLNSAEGCDPYAPFSHWNKETELWADRESYLANVSVRDAVDYVRTKMSLKVMPIAYRHGDDLRQFFAALPEMPVFVLRRRAEDCYASLLHARKTGKWIRNNANATERAMRAVGEVVKDKAFETYERSLLGFFTDVEAMMKEVGVRWDRVNYEDVTRERVIIGQRNGCYIKNCNYA